jgi:hypothetical protein
MSVSPIDAWTIRRLLTGQSLNGEPRTLSGPFRQLAAHLDVLPTRARQTAFDGFLCGRSDGETLVKALADVDPSSPPPEPEPAARCATLTDVRRLMADDQWLWKAWLAVAVLNGLAADPGTGKTIMAMDLARRLWFRLPWPDGQPNTLPEETRTLWVPGDRHYGQLLGLAQAFKLPDEALILNAPADDPTAGLDLDDPAVLADLSARIRGEAPGLVIVDTVGMTTAKNLCKPEDARDYFGPLMDMARDSGVPFLLHTHLSREGQALGRRIVAACRLVWKMTDPHPEGQPNRRRLWVDKTYAEKPPALGMTIGAAGCDFDSKPPTAPAPASVGRPSKERDEATRFLTEKLTPGDRKQCELVSEWEALGKPTATLFNAFKAMQAYGRLVIDDGVKPKVCHLVKNPPGGQEPDS